MNYGHSFLNRTAAIAILVLAGCQTSTTQVERAARAKEIPNAPYTNILVVGVTYRADTGRAFEKVLVEELANYNTRARAFHIVESTTDVSDDVVRNAAERVGADAVLVVRVENVDTDVKIGESRVDIKESNQKGGLVEFFSRDYEEIKSAPTVDLKFTARIVTDLYDAKSSERVYTVESATANAKTAEQIIVGESSAITARMHSDGIIR